MGSTMHYQSHQRKFRERERKGGRGREREGAQLSGQSSNESREEKGKSPAPCVPTLGILRARLLPRAAGMIGFKKNKQTKATQ